MSDFTLNAEERILEAARQEFITRGPAGARMQSIADQAGVNKALLHYYYRNKARLYEAVLKNILESFWETLRREFQSPAVTEDFQSLVRTWVSTYIRMLAKHPDFMRIILREMMDGGPHIPLVLDDLLKAFEDVIGKIIGGLQTGIQNGKFRAIAPIDFIMNVMGMCLATFLMRPMLDRFEAQPGWIKSTVTNTKEDHLERRIQSIVEMVFHGLSRQGEVA